MYLGLWPIELIIVPSSLGGLSPLLTLWLLDRSSKDQRIVGPIFESIHSWKKHIHWLIVAATAYPLLIVAGNLVSFSAGYELQLVLLNPGPAELGFALIAIIPITFFAGTSLVLSLKSPGGGDLHFPNFKPDSAASLVV